MVAEIFILYSANIVCGAFCSEFGKLIHLFTVMAFLEVQSCHTLRTAFTVAVISYSIAIHDQLISVSAILNQSVSESAILDQSVSVSAIRDQQLVSASDILNQPVSKSANQDQPESHWIPLPSYACKPFDLLQRSWMSLETFWRDPVLFILTDPES